MAVKIRLTRIGAKGKPIDRVVVADSESPRDGKFLEILGNYDPRKNPAEIILKEERVREWLAKGAKPKLTVSPLLAKKVIGKQGRTAKAMRTILSAASTKIRKRTILEIIE